MKLLILQSDIYVLDFNIIPIRIDIPRQYSTIFQLVIITSICYPQLFDKVRIPSAVYICDSAKLKYRLQYQPKL